MRPAYRSSKKVKDYDKLEAEKIESTLHDDLALMT
ncbi:BnaA03g60540D [Brassica napus]|uniref:BnaA03g60540D protein n=1 Tax=Brassica napus TaxID=3708 RepID=A0A078H073_BRANA|nr:BnaA03g60540D [Brassica napus]